MPRSVQQYRRALIASMAPPRPTHPCLQLVAPDSIENKFRALEGSDVDDDLAKMKAALGSGKVAGEVGAGGRGWLGPWAVAGSSREGRGHGWMEGAVGAVGAGRVLRVGGCACPGCEGRMQAREQTAVSVQEEPATPAHLLSCTLPS